MKGKKNTDRKLVNYNSKKRILKDEREKKKFILTPTLKYLNKG